MATEEEVTKVVKLGPQTPAARRAQPLVEEGLEPLPEETPAPPEPIGPVTPVARELAQIEESVEAPEVVAALEPPPPPQAAAPPEVAAAPDIDLEPAIETDPAVEAEPEVEPEPQIQPEPAEVPGPTPEAAPTAAPRPGPPPGAAVAALATLGSGLAMLLVLVSAIGPSEPPTLAGGGNFEATPSLREVAPGGRILLTGSGAPGDAPMTLETRTAGGEWQAAGEAVSGDDGAFRVSGRVAAAPGRVMVRARAGGAATSTPVGVDVRPLRLSSVGDINLGDVAGAGIAAEGPRYPWASAGRKLRSADIAFGNLECAISKRGTPFEKLYNFRGTPAALQGLARHSGIDVLNLANNHVGDYGPRAMLDTVRWVERFGMQAVGAGRNLRRALEPQVLERLGLKVAFVGFSEIAPIEFAAVDGRPGTAWATPESVAAAVHDARRQADVVVATFHWGIEKASYETAQQQVLAAAAAAAGAQLVIGAHPHVLQPLRRQGAALVAYSLGNFVFGAASSDTTATGILETDLSSEGVLAARWRPGEIAGGRPHLKRSPGHRLPVDDAEAMAAGVSL
jgi:poly-gamma-glutamate capsule biosynthesis protein CapA/YwtB (metallophosphatase superfamily)